MIRYNEIMIGDYVLVKGTPRKVEAITKKKIGYHTNPLKIGLSYSRLCECDHIKITPDWLLEKGFIQRNAYNRDMFTKLENDYFLIVEYHCRLSMTLRIDDTQRCSAIGFPTVYHIPPTLAGLQNFLRLTKYDKYFNIEP